MISLFQPISLDFVIGLFWIVILLLFSALISGSEIAFFSINPEMLEKISEEDSSKSRNVAALLKKPNHLLATILIANNFVNVAIVILSTYLTTQLFDFTNHKWLEWVFQVVIVTALILLFGEVMPKILATQQPVRFAKKMAKTFSVLSIILYPFSKILTQSTSFIDRRLAGKQKNISLEELSSAIDITSNESSDDETRMLKGVVRFSDTEVKEIMHARVDVTAVEVDYDFKELLSIILESGFSRIPVFQETFDNVLGILYIKDLLTHLNKSSDYAWKDLIRPAFFVPENKPINDLLENFREKKIHMAIVVDEYGGTSGIVTLEDILEEIIGDISDEFDAIADEVEYTKIDDSTFVFEGKTSINDFCKITKIEDDFLDSIKGDSDSLAGLFLELSGKIPEIGEKKSYKNLNFTIKNVDNRRIISIEVFIKK